MADDYLIVSKKILPDYLSQVIHARAMLADREARNVTEAVRMAGISRSTYYKYKDYVFLPEERQTGRKAVISLVIKHEPGSLSAVLKTLSDLDTSVITIAQSLPVAGKASVTISLDISSLRGPTDSLIRSLKQIPAVYTAQLNAME